MLKARKNTANKIPHDVTAMINQNRPQVMYSVWYILCWVSKGGPEPEAVKLQMISVSDQCLIHTSYTIVLRGIPWDISRVTCIF